MIRATIISSFAGAKITSIALFTAVALAGCTTLSSSQLGLAGRVETRGPEMPASEAIGDGQVIVGVISGPDSDNLSNGVVNSMQLAARLAAINVNSEKVRFELRAVNGSTSSVGRVGAEFRDLGVSLVIAGLDIEDTLALRSALGNATIPILSTARSTESKPQTYWAGFNPLEEAAALTIEAKRRGIKRLLVIESIHIPSQQLGSIVVSIAAQAGLETWRLSVSSTGEVAVHLANLSSETQPDAVVCALAVSDCAAALAGLENSAGAQIPQIIGHSGWAVSAVPETLGAGWFPGPPASGLNGFVSRFQTAYGVVPSLESALFYDLVILAGALPKVVENSPYASDVIANAQGFEGFAGQLRLTASGLPQQRRYTIWSFP
jgi:ABC-type branched-subunit amino acid transport system substrate-binding protein